MKTHAESQKDVKDGAVTLTGRLDTFTEKHAIDWTVRRVPGLGAARCSESYRRQNSPQIRGGPAGSRG